MTLLLEIRPKTSFFAPTGETDGGSGQNRVVMGIFSSLNGLDWQPAPRAAFGAQRIFAAVANFAATWTRHESREKEAHRRQAAKLARVDHPEARAIPRDRRGRE
jgi:hypothetical protein